LSYVANGGALIVGQPNPFNQPNNEVEITILPSSIVVNSAVPTGEFAIVELEDHPLVEGLNVFELPVPSDEVTLNEEEWDVIVKGGVTSFPSLAHSNYGLGDVLLFISASSPNAFNPVSDAFYTRMIQWMYEQNNPQIPEINVLVDQNILSTDYPNAESYQWINCETGEEIVGATDPIYVVTEDGEYAVVVTDPCAIGSACVNVSFISINEEEALPEIVVYPNPTQGRFTINCGDSNPSSITIWSSSGQLVQDLGLMTTKQKTFDLALESGSYVLEMSSEQGTVRKILFAQ